MGRSASTLENMIGFDPITYAQRRQQLFNAPVAQAQNPYERMGAALGNIVGGSIFGLEDPNLKRASDINRIYSDVMAGTDPTQSDFADRLGILTRQLANAGYGDAALYAANQARVIKKETAAEARAIEELGIRKSELGLRERQVLLDEVSKDPYGSIAKAMQMPEDSPQRQVILAGASAAIGQRNFDQAVKEAQIRASEASAAASRAQVERAAGGEVSETLLTEDGEPLTKRGGKLYKMDGTAYTGKVKRLPTPSPYAALLEGGGAATPGQPTRPGQPKLSDEEVRRLLRGAARVPEVGGSTWDMGQ